MPKSFLVECPECILAQFDNIVEGVEVLRHTAVLVRGLLVIPPHTFTGKEWVEQRREAVRWGPGYTEYRDVPPKGVDTEVECQGFTFRLGRQVTDPADPKVRFKLSTDEVMEFMSGGSMWFTTGRTVHRGMQEVIRLDPVPESDGTSHS